MSSRMHHFPNRRPPDHRIAHLASRRTDAQHPRGSIRSVLELVGRVRRDVDRFTDADDLLLTTKSCMNLAFDHDEGLFEIGAVGRRSAADRNEHVDETEMAFRIVASEQDRIGIANQSDMRKVGVSFGPHKPEVSSRDRPVESPAWVLFPIRSCLPP